MMQSPLSLFETFLCQGQMSDESLLEEVKLSAITLSKVGFFVLDVVGFMAPGCGHIWS